MARIFTPTRRAPDDENVVSGATASPGEPPASAGHIAATSPQAKRKRGAQPGNNNAVRHGFYSRFFTRAEMSGLDSDVKGEFHDEINLARVNAIRLAEVLQDYKSMSIEDFIAASNALSHYLDRIRSLTRAQKFIYQNQTTIEQALEELKDLSPYED
jgi:hypothetical protein